MIGIKYFNSQPNKTNILYVSLTGTLPVSFCDETVMKEV
jgi:hypothetical protein